MNLKHLKHLSQVTGATTHQRAGFTFHWQQKEWLRLFSVNVFLFLRGCDTLSFFKIFNLIVMDLFCRGIRNMTTKF